MQSTKKQESPILKLHPHKTCTCGACYPPKPKLPKGIRRLKNNRRVSYQEASL